MEKSGVKYIVPTFVWNECIYIRKIFKDFIVLFMIDILKEMCAIELYEPLFPTYLYPNHEQQEPILNRNFNFIRISDRVHIHYRENCKQNHDTRLHQMLPH